MVYVLVFSLSIAIFSSTHQIGWVILGVVLIGLVLGVQRIKGEERSKGEERIKGAEGQRSKGVVLFIVAMVGVGAVVVYDRRMMESWEGLVDFYQGFERTQYLDPDAQLIVKERDKMGRYGVEVMEQSSKGEERSKGEESASGFLRRVSGYFLERSSQGHSTSRGFVMLLYSDQEINPGDVIMTTKRPIWRVDNSRSENKEERFDYNKRLYMKGIDGSLYDNNVSVVGQQSLGWIETIRESFYQRVKENKLLSKSPPDPPLPLPPREGQNNKIVVGLILGMTIGDRSLIDKDWYQQFIDSGLVHLIAVSGGNIAIIVLFVGLFLFRLPFYVRQFVLLLSVLCYAMLVGSDSSILRATVMGVLTILALFPGRQISIWRSMGYARVGMLLRNPYYLLYDLGFGLSFAAIVGMVEVEEVYKVYKVHKVYKVDKVGKVWQWIASERILLSAKTFLAMTMERSLALLRMTGNYVLKNYILPTLGAMAGVTPLLLWSMEQTNIASPLFNFLVVPLVPIVTIGGFIIPWLPDWMSRCHVVFVYLIDWIVQVSAWGREYGVYMSMTDSVKDVFVCVVIGWRVVRKLTPTKE